MDQITTVSETMTSLFQPPANVEVMHKCSCNRGMVYGTKEKGKLRYLKNGNQEIKTCSSCIDDKCTESMNIKIKKASERESLERQVRAEFDIPAGVSAAQWIKDNQGRKLRNGKRIGD